MNVYLSDEELKILDKVVDEHKADNICNDRECALRYLIYYYNARQELLNSNKVEIIEGRMI